MSTSERGRGGSESPQRGTVFVSDERSEVVKEDVVHGVGVDILLVKHEVSSLFMMLGHVP